MDELFMLHSIGPEVLISSCPMCLHLPAQCHRDDPQVHLCSSNNLCLQMDRWKSIQLSILTIWNVGCRSANMERRVVESGIAVQLLDIICNENWPPSLRDMAGGCLEFLSERYSNLRWVSLVKTSTCVSLCVVVCVAVCMNAIELC